MTTPKTPKPPPPPCRTITCFGNYETKESKQRTRDYKNFMRGYNYALRKTK